MNIIVGHNSSGKTLIYNLISYTLGIRQKMLIRDKNISRGLKICLEIEVEDKLYKFYRDIKSNNINIETEGKTTNYNTQSSAYYSYLNKLLDPQFVFESDERSIIDILKYCFISEFNISNSRRIKDNGFLSLILGFDYTTVNKYKQDIENFELKLVKDENTNKELKMFKNRVISGVNKLEIEKNTKNDFNTLIDKEFYKVYDTLIKQNEMLKESKMAYERINSTMNKLYELRRKELIDLINISIVDLDIQVKELNPVRTVEHSYHVNTIIELLARDLLVELGSQTNFPGFIIQDSIDATLNDKYNIKLAQVRERCMQKQDYQLILFTTRVGNINKSDIVLDLDKEEVMEWL